MNIHDDEIAAAARREISRTRLRLAQDLGADYCERSEDLSLLAEDTPRMQRKDKSLLNPIPILREVSVLGALAKLRLR